MGDPEITQKLNRQLLLASETPHQREGAEHAADERKASTNQLPVKAILERFAKAKGRAPASVDEIKAFLIEEQLNGKWP
jgi:hypothetical protein